MKRPFAVIGLSLMGSLILASCLSERTVVLIGVGLLLVGTVLLFLCKKSKAMPVCLLVGVAGIFLYLLTVGRIYKPLEKYAGMTCEISGVVTKTEQTMYGTYRAYMDVHTVDEQAVSFRIRLTTDKECLTPYEAVTLTTTLKKPANTPGSDFNNVNYLRSKGIAFTAFATDTEVFSLGMTERPWYTFFDDLRQRFLRALDDTLGPQAGIAKAVMLGEKTGLTVEQNDAFRIIGVSHLFAVSGLHLSVLLSAFLWLAKRTVKCRVLVLSGGMILVLFFMGLTGFPMSVLRAGIMVLLMLIAQLIYREADALNSLGVAVTVLVLLNPLSALDVGLEMSVCATLGLVTVGNRLSAWFFSLGKKKNKEAKESQPPSSKDVTKTAEDKEENGEEEPSKWVKLLRKAGNRLYRFVAASVITSLSANVFLLPIYAAYFGSVSLLMPLANLLFIPVGSGILICSMLSALLYLIPAVGPLLAYLPSKVNLFFLLLADGLRETLAGIPGQNVGVSGSLQQLTVWFLVLFTVLWLFSSVTHVKGKAAALCCTVVLLVSIVLNRVFLFPRTTVHFWGNERSVCMLINHEGTSTVLTKEGYYADQMAEQFGNRDGCITQNTDIPKEKSGYTYETVADGNGRISAVILSGKSGKILLVDRPDETVASVLESRNEYYGLVCLMADEDSFVGFLMKGRAADTVVLCRTYKAPEDTASKLRYLGYRVTDITDKEGVTVTLTPNGRYSIQGTEGE